MINSQKKSMKILFIISIVLLAAALVLSVVMLFMPATKFVGLIYFNNAAGILAILSAFLYVFGGYKKNDAIYYKTFMVLVCIKYLFTLIQDISFSLFEGYTSPVSEILLTIVIVNLVILSFAKDLGKNTSMGLAGGILGVSFINTIRLVILYPNIDVLFNYLVCFALAFLVLLLVIGKYVDKTERGTK